MFAVIFGLVGCANNNEIPLVSYERYSEFEILGFKMYENTIYNPLLKAEDYLDLDMLDEASGYYLILNPTQILINQLVFEGYTLYQNDKGEVIVNV